MKSIITPEYQKYTQGRIKVSGSIPKVKLDNTHINTILNSRNTNLPKFTGKSNRTGGYYSTILDLISKVESQIPSDNYNRLQELLRITSEENIEKALDKVENFGKVKFYYLDAIRYIKELSENIKKGPNNKSNSTKTYEESVKELNQIVKDLIQFLSESKEETVEEQSPEERLKRMKSDTNEYIKSLSRKSFFSYDDYYGYSKAMLED